MNAIHKLNLSSFRNLLNEIKRPAITEYRCGSCGNFFPGDMLNEVRYRDWQNGDWIDMLQCDGCVHEKKRDQLLRDAKL